MRTIEYKNSDRSNWPDGPWMNEPDKIQYECPITGYPCLIVRNHLGALCGYVGVPSMHPLYKHDYMDENLLFQKLQVHGGITFSDICEPTEDQSIGICHKVEDGEDDNVWWFGFDCAHMWDLVPLLDFTFARDDIYRDINYVKCQIQHIAKQLWALR